MEPLAAPPDAIVPFVPSRPTDPPDPACEPDGFIVVGDDGTRLHFLDWGPAAAPGSTGALLIHGLAGSAWAWAPVARRLRRRAHVVAPDLRGCGLSDAPTTGYDRTTLVDDARAVAEGSGLIAYPGAPGPERVVVAGHGAGAAVAAWLAADLGPRCAGLVLVDGGWEDLTASGITADELLREIEEPPEVLASMAAFLADREAFDPATWDLDQERAARATVVEVPAGRVVPVVRPHALAASVAAMLSHDPVATLVSVVAPIVVVTARDDEEGSRRLELERVAAAVFAAGRRPIVVADSPGVGHNLMRYRPDLVAAAIAAFLEPG
jgi:pimeloyl-ACP methyl ester carboxylesterase